MVVFLMASCSATPKRVSPDKGDPTYCQGTRTPNLRPIHAHALAGIGSKGTHSFALAIVTNATLGGPMSSSELGAQAFLSLPSFLSCIV